MTKAPGGDYLHLELRHQTWFVTRDIPRPLQALMGRKRLTQTLKTHDIVQARKDRHDVLAEFERVIKAAQQEATRSPAPDNLTQEAIRWTDPGNLRTIGDADDHALLRAELLGDRVAEIYDTHGSSAARSFKGIASGSAVPIGLHTETWLAESKYAARSLIQHRQAIRELTDWCVASKSPTDVQGITRKVAGNFISAAAKGKQSPKTVNRKLSTLRAYWAWMVQRGHVEDDPWKGQALPTKRAHGGEEVNTERPFTDDEVATLLAGDASKDLKDFMLIGALSGMRIGEIANLTVGDCVGEVFTVRASKSNAGLRRTPIHSALSPMVAARMKDQKATAWLFPKLTARKTGERSMAMSQGFGRYRKKLGVTQNRPGQRHSDITFHSFRKWFVTASLQAGQPVHIVQQVVGHSRDGVTLSVYHGGDTIERLREAVEVVKLPPLPRPPWPPENTNRSP